MRPHEKLMLLSNLLGFPLCQLLDRQAAAVRLEGDLHLELQWREAEDALWLAACMGRVRPAQRHALAMSALLSTTLLCQADGTRLALDAATDTLYLCCAAPLGQRTPGELHETVAQIASLCRAYRQQFLDAQLLDA